MRLVDEADQRLAEQIGFRVAQQPLCGLVAALDEAVRGGHEHRIAQAVEHGVQVILGDGRFGELLAHALERVLQFAELVAARDVERPRVVAFADAVRRLDQRRDRLATVAAQ